MRATPNLELSTMKRSVLASLVLLATLTGPAAAQQWAVDDPMLKRIWEEGTVRSQLYPLAQVMLDSVGPRLTGTPDAERAQDWLVAAFRGFGIDARKEQYGTWAGWRRGITHIDLLKPRVRTLEGILLGWSAGTKGKPVQGPVIVLPEFADSVASFRSWLPNVRGKFVALDFAQPTCRPDRQWEAFGASGRPAGFMGFGGPPAPPPATDTLHSFGRMVAQRTAARTAWAVRVARTGLGVNELRAALEDAGALGFLHSNWSNETGINKVFTAVTRRAPALDLSCEDYGLVYRLAERGQGPVIRVTAEGEALGEVPIYNVVAEIRGSEKPDEYVLLSAHYDSFDAGSGATDNATGSVTMLEAMRILKQVYPNPKRTIIAGFWNSEEQGLNGSRAFVTDHPEIVAKLHAVFNQDNGTGRIQNISGQGLLAAGEYFARWFAKLPTDLTREIRLNIPGSPGGGGSDYASFVCAGAPGFGLSSLGWDYGTYTWHTNRDTFDKLVFDDLRNNVLLVAMLTYLAAEDPVFLPRERRTLGMNGEPINWPACRDAMRSGPRR
jgi:hypothetical protein